MDTNVTIGLGYHQIDASQAARDLRARVEACPAVVFKQTGRDFTVLEVGALYYFKHGYQDGGDRLLLVERITPSGKQADVEIWNGKPGGWRTKMHSAQWYGTFYHVTNDLFHAVLTAHTETVEEAVKRGLDVPVEVRCDYPALFVEIPERFTVPGADPAHPKSTPAERVRSALRPYFKKCTSTLVESWIAQRRKTIHRLTEEYDRRIAQGERDDSDRCLTAQDYSGYIEDAFGDVDFYRWLLPHVSPGGVFYRPEEVREA